MIVDNRLKSFEGISRPSGRERIETGQSGSRGLDARVSLVLRGESGLKPLRQRRRQLCPRVSLVLRGESGLKTRPSAASMTFIGEDRVIVVRDNDGNPQVLVNTCRHRGNAICRAEEGHATSFMCHARDG